MLLKEIRRFEFGNSNPEIRILIWRSGDALDYVKKLGDLPPNRDT